MAVEMTPNKFVDLCFTSCMQVLEFMNGLKFDNVQAIRKDAIGLSLEKMFALVRSNVRDSGENVGAMSSGTLDTVSVVYSSLSCFMVNIKVLQIVVEID